MHDQMIKMHPTGRCPTVMSCSEHAALQDSGHPHQPHAAVQFNCQMSSTEILQPLLRNGFNSKHAWFMLSIHVRHTGKAESLHAASCVFKTLETQQVVGLLLHHEIDRTIKVLAKCMPKSHSIMQIIPTRKAGEHCCTNMNLSTDDWSSGVLQLASMLTGVQVLCAVKHRTQLSRASSVRCLVGSHS